LSKFRSKKSNLQTFKETKRQVPEGTQVLSIVEQLDDGRGVAKFKGKIVFVDGALKGETVKVQFKKSFKNFDEATSVKIISPVSDRIQPQCQYYERCGGCNLQHMKLQAQRTFKQKSIEKRMVEFGLVKNDELESVISPLLTSDPFQYRHRARFSVEANSHKFVLGFKGNNSNKVIDIDSCEVLLPGLNTVLPKLRLSMSGLSYRSSIREILILEDSNGKAFIQIRSNKRLADRDVDSLKVLSDRENIGISCKNLVDQMTYWSSDDTQPLTQLSNESVSYNYSLDDFTQINPTINEKMIQQTCEWLDLSEEDHVIDLFCGIGNFSLPAAKNVKGMTGYEISEKMVKKAAQNAKENGLSNTTFFAVDLFSHSLKFDRHVNKLILDPPRAGAEHVCAQLVPPRIQYILYISCNPSSFFRDSKILIDGGYVIDKLGLIDMFPQTEHVEIMALFSHQ